MKKNNTLNCLIAILLMCSGFLNEAYAEITNIPAFVGGLQEKNIAQCHQKVFELCDSNELNRENKSCIEEKMAKIEDCDQAKEFLKLTDGLIETITHYRYVDVVYASVLGADHADDFFMLGHSGDFINLLGTPDVELKKVSGFTKIVKRFPDVILWPVAAADFDAPKQQRLKTGGDRIVFKQEMTNQCMACEKAGLAFVAYDFDSTGNFTGAKVERLLPAVTKK